MLETAPEAAEGKGLVQTSAAQLREMIYDARPGARIGSLRSIADRLGVGIVTVQQAARILEHEGLLEVRRGPGGGYYGKRPDQAALARALGAYMRAEPRSWEEALDMTSLLFNELAASAAECRDAALHDELRGFLGRIPACRDETDLGHLEEQLQDLLFRMVDRPLFELLTRVTLGLAVSRPEGSPFSGLIGLASWKAGRCRIIEAILAGDAELARFEADRNNRRLLMDSIRRSSETAAKPV